MIESEDLVEVPTPHQKMWGELIVGIGFIFSFSLMSAKSSEDLRFSLASLIYDWSSAADFSLLLFPLLYVAWCLPQLRGRGGHSKSYSFVCLCLGFSVLAGEIVGMFLGAGRFGLVGSMLVIAGACVVIWLHFRSFSKDMDPPLLREQVTSKGFMVLLAATWEFPLLVSG